VLLLLEEGGLFGQHEGEGLATGVQGGGGREGEGGGGELPARHVF
jgi:hypothetical protein